MGATAYYCSGSLDSSTILAIFIASLRAVSCAAAIVFAGLWMARRGLMTNALAKGLSEFSVKLAIPCLLFSSVVPGVSPMLLAYGWPLMLLPAVYLLVGTLLGLLLLMIVNPPADFRLGVVASCAFYNTTSIPIIILSVLQQTLSRSVFAELASPLLFLSLQLLTYPLLQWLYSMFLIDAYAFLSDRFARDASNYNELSGAYARYDSSLEHNAVPGSLLDVRSVEANSTNGPDDANFFAFMPRPIARSIGQPAAYAHQALIGPSGGGASSWPVDLRDRTLGWLYALPRRLARLLRRVLIPSVLGIVIGGVVGLMGKTLVLPPETAPLGWLFISATKLGEAAVPINLVLLGAALSRRPESKDLPVLTAVSIVVARMVVMPLLGLVAAYVLTTSGSRLIQPYLTVDPFWLVFLIVTCTPTANNIVVLCELAGENKHTMSAAIFYQYCAAPILLPGVLTLYVAFICHNREVIHGDM